MPEITIGRLRGGYCVSWYEGGKRRRHQLTSRTKAEAEAEAVDVYRRHTFKQDQDCIVERLWEIYVDSLAGKPAAATLGYTGKSVLRHFGKYRPDQISIELCRDYAALREREGKSQGTVHTELGHLKQTLNFARKVGMIDRAPHIWRPNKPAPREVFLTRDEIRKLIDHTATPHMELAITLLAGTAARVGAVLDLTWDRVDFERGIINYRLPDSVTRKGRAVVPMNGWTRAALQTARDAALSEYVVEYGGQRVKSIRKGFDSAKGRAELKHITIHDVRRSGARFMVEAGVPMEQVSQMLGHSNLAITFSTYGRFAPDSLAEAAEVLNFSARLGSTN